MTLVLSVCFRETEHVIRGEQQRGRERERERIFKQAPCWSHDPGIMTWAKIKSQSLNWLSHPGTPYAPFLIYANMSSKKRLLFLFSWGDLFLCYSLSHYPQRDTPSFSIFSPDLISEIQTQTRTCLLHTIWVLPRHPKLSMFRIQFKHSGYPLHCIFKPQAAKGKIFHPITRAKMLELFLATVLSPYLPCQGCRESPPFLLSKCILHPSAPMNVHWH